MLSVFRALEKAAEVLKSSQQGRQKTVIFITDEQTNADSTAEAANTVRAEGATIYAVGVGDLQGTEAELESIAGAKDRVFVKEINQINAEFGEELGGKVCTIAARVKRFWPMLKYY